MKFKHTRVALAIALLLAGCGTQAAPTANPTASSADPLGLGDSIAPRYQALSQNAIPVAIATVAASSTGTQVTGFTASVSSTWSDKWFSVSNLTDGNLHSAWEPAAHIMDTAPTLTLNLAQATQLTGLGIKMDAGATFDVQVNNGGAWTTVATNVAPQYRALDFIGLPASTARQVKLVFHVGPNAKLLVCEVKLFSGGSNSPSTAPSTVPSTTPSTAPSPSPSTMPSSCLALNLHGDLYTDGAQSFGPPTLSLSITASEDASGAVFGSFEGGYGGGGGPFGVVKSIQITGDTVTVTASETDDGSGAYSPGADVTVVAEITGRNGDSFDGYITNVTLPSESFANVTIAHPSGAFTMHGSYGACQPSPLECFKLDGESAFFDESGKGDVITVTNLVHSGANTSGSITFQGFGQANAGPDASGQITSAVVAGDMITLSGTLTSGGTFKLATKIFEVEQAQLRVVPTNLVETDASGSVVFSLAPEFNPDLSAGIDGTFGCQ